MASVCGNNEIFGTYSLYFIGIMFIERHKPMSRKHEVFNLH